MSYQSHPRRCVLLLNKIPRIIDQASRRKSDRAAWDARTGIPIGARWRSSRGSSAIDLTICKRGKHAETTAKNSAKCPRNGTFPRLSGPTTQCAEYYSDFSHEKPGFAGANCLTCKSEFDLQVGIWSHNLSTKHSLLFSSTTDDLLTDFRGPCTKCLFSQITGNQPACNERESHCSPRCLAVASAAGGTSLHHTPAVSSFASPMAAMMATTTGHVTLDADGDASLSFSGGLRPRAPRTPQALAQ